MHYIRGQWIILEDTIIRLDYAVSREATSSIYIYIQGGVGKRQVHIIPHRQ
jgi:hypothetical protein